MALSLVGAKATAVNVKSYGAVGDGVTDDQAAISACFSANSGNGKFIYFPAGTYLHSAKLNSGNVIFGDGNDAAIIKATNQISSSIYFAGDGVGAANLTIDGGGTVRQSNNDRAAIVALGATNYTFRNLHIYNSPSVGIFSIGNTTVSGTICNNYIHDCLADGIGNYNGCRGQRIYNNYIYHSGDDGISVVSVNTNPQSADIQIYQNFVADNINARGITCVGAENVWIQGNYIKNVTTAAGIYLNPESSYNAQSNDTIIVFNNILENCGKSAIGQGALSLHNSGGYGGCQNAGYLVANNVMANCPWIAVTVVGGYPVWGRIFNNVHYSDTQGVYFKSNISAFNDLRLSNNYVLGASGYVAPNITASVGIDRTFSAS